MMPPLPEWAKDAVVVHVDVFLDWKDRLKVLFGCRLTVKSYTFTENLPGRTETVSEVNVWRYRPLPPGWGAVEIPAPGAPPSEEPKG
jgi:hypothetical protein